jgi:hypothetical protein
MKKIKYKRLKIPKGYSEGVNQRRAKIQWSKEKRQKYKKITYKTLHRKQKTGEGYSRNSR